MQVSVENTSELERRMTVQVPAERIDEEVDSRLRSLAKRARIDGFRPGKVPFSVVKNRYADEVRQEVMGDVIQSTFYEALTQEKLRPAGMPSIEPLNNEPGKEFEYAANFEVYPEVKVADVSGLKVTRPQSEVTEADVDKVIETLRKQRTEWEEQDKAAEKEDRLTISFKGTIDGEAFQGGEAEDVPLVLGSNSMIPGFEDQLLGAKQGENRTVEVTFPDEYPTKELAGKQAQFAVEVTKVEVAKLPEVNEEFAKGFGVEEGGVEKLRENVRASVEKEVERKLKSELKNAVMDALANAHEVTVPKSLLNEEIKRMQSHAASQMGDQAQGMELPPNLFEEGALKRIKLGLIVGEIVKENELKVEADQVRSYIEQIAADYEKPEEVVNWYYGNKEQLESVEAVVLEEQVVDWVLSQAKVTDETLTYEQLLEK